MGSRVACTGYVQSFLYIVIMIVLVVIIIRLGLVKSKDTGFSIKKLLIAFKRVKTESIIAAACAYNLYILSDMAHHESSVLVIVFLGYLIIGAILVAVCNERMEPNRTIPNLIFRHLLDGFVVAVIAFTLAGALPEIMRLKATTEPFDNGDYYLNPGPAAAMLILPFFLVLQLKQTASDQRVIWAIYGSFIVLMLYFAPGAITFNCTQESKSGCWYLSPAAKREFKTYFVLHYSLLMCWLFHMWVLPEKRRLQNNANLGNAAATVAPFVLAGLMMGGMLCAIADPINTAPNRAPFLFIIIGHGCIGGSIGLVLHGLETIQDTLQGCIAFLGTRINQLAIFYKNLLEKK